MVQVTQRTGFTGSALVGLLVRLTDGGATEAADSFSERLSHWLRWTDAIALSTALDGNAALPSTAAPAAAGRSADTAEKEYRRVQAAQQRSIAGDVAFLAEAVRAPLALPGGAVQATAGDFAPFRLRYHARQQGMEAGIGPLRTRLRALLESCSPAMARLAAVDAVMEQALGPQERALLGTVPGLLEKHFGRLRDAGAGEEPPGAWAQRFCQDMHGVLQAELELRLQPVQGLLQALRNR